MQSFCFWVLSSPVATVGQTSEREWKACETPLFAAVHNRDAAEALRVVKSGVDLNARPCGVTSLAEAIVYGETNVFEELLAKGAIRTGVRFCDYTGVTDDLSVRRIEKGSWTIIRSFRGFLPKEERTMSALSELSQKDSPR
jgi:hypothetical protein